MLTAAPALREREDINLITAGFLQRWLASIIDTLILLPLFFLYNLPLLKSSFEAVLSLPEPWYQWGWWRAAALIAALFCYGWLLVGGRGRTIGMSALGISVTRLNGEPIGYGIAALRGASLLLPPFVVYVFPTSLLISPLITAAMTIGLLWIIVDRAHQGYHDKIAGTLVVREYYLPEPVPGEAGGPPK